MGDIRFFQLISRGIGAPWSTVRAAYHGALTEQNPMRFELPNAHNANRQMVRVEVHEQLGEREARQLGAAIRKIARYYAIR
jgi:hypothetical protein